MNHYFQPRNFRHATIEADGCSPVTSPGPVTRCGIGVGVGIVAGLVGIANTAYNWAGGNTPDRPANNGAQPNVVALLQAQSNLGLDGRFQNSPAQKMLQKSIAGQLGPSAGGVRVLGAVSNPSLSQTGSPLPVNVTVASDNTLQYVSIGFGVLSIGMLLFAHHRKAKK